MTINRKAIVLFLQELRSSVRQLALAIVCWTLLIFLWSDRLLPVLQAHVGGKLYFFSVAEPFLAHVKLSFFTALFVLMPLLLRALWRALALPFGMSTLRRAVFTVATTILFYSGALFCYQLTLPYGIQFLLGFGGETLTPAISINRFANFISIFVLAFGLLFELPVFMIFCTSTGLVSCATFMRHRRYAVLIIAILAAVLTPTPDVVNMALMGCPLYFLYELGIVLIRLFRLDRNARAARAKQAPTEEGQVGLKS